MLGVATLSVAMLGIIYAASRFYIMGVIMPSVDMLSVIMLIVLMLTYAECHSYLFHAVCFYWVAKYHHHAK